MSCGENSSDYQAKKITALKDGLRNHDRQCGVQERKAAGEREDDRYQKQQRDYQQEDFQPEQRANFRTYASGQDPRPLRLSAGARVHAAAAAFGWWLAFQLHGSKSATDNGLSHGPVVNARWFITLVIRRSRRPSAQHERAPGRQIRLGQVSADELIELNKDGRLIERVVALADVTAHWRHNSSDIIDQVLRDAAKPKARLAARPLTVY
jgi:hypothetical protein